MDGDAARLAREFVTTFSDDAKLRLEVLSEILEVCLERSYCRSSADVDVTQARIAEVIFELAKISTKALALADAATKKPAGSARSVVFRNLAAS